MISEEDVEKRAPRCSLQMSPRATATQISAPGNTVTEPAIGDAKMKTKVTLSSEFIHEKTPKLDQKSNCMMKITCKTIPFKIHRCLSRPCHR